MKGGEICSGIFGNAGGVQGTHLKGRRLVKPSVTEMILIGKFRFPFLSGVQLMETGFAFLFTYWSRRYLVCNPTVSLMDLGLI